MDIYSKYGTKVIFAHPTYGYMGDQEQAAKYLKEGEIYTIKEIQVGHWSSSVRLEEVPEQTFNTVLFEGLQ